MKKKLIVTHGIKGGIGKSLMAALLVDLEIQNGKNILIVESDGHVPDVAERYAKIVRSKVAPVLETESLYRLLAEIESDEVQSAETVVLNLPANSQAIDECAQEFVEVAHELGFEVRTIYMIAESPDSARLAQKSLDTGLIKYSDFALGVVNQHFGRYESDFYWTNSD